MIGWIIAGIFVFAALAVIGWIIGFYNTVINALQDVKNMFSNILTEYQRRADLFMNLVESVKGSAKFEKSTLTEVVKARNGKFETSKGDALKQLQGLDKAFSKLNFLVEAYPQLRSTESYSKLMDEIRLTEDRINIARTDYNGIVRDYNTYIKEFPNNFLARIFAFAAESFFETDKKNYDAPKIDLSL